MKNKNPFWFRIPLKIISSCWFAPPWRPVSGEAVHHCYKGEDAHKVASFCHDRAVLVIDCVGWHHAQPRKQLTSLGWFQVQHLQGQPPWESSWKRSFKGLLWIFSSNWWGIVSKRSGCGLCPDFTRNGCPSMNVPSMSDPSSESKAECPNPCEFRHSAAPHLPNSGWGGIQRGKSQVKINNDKSNLA